MNETVTVKIKNGFIRGCREEGTIAFKGIPFALPPIGQARFQAPSPCKDWEGILDCTKYGTRPVQTPPPWCEDKETALYGEDCLNLNVWTPAADGKKGLLFSRFSAADSWKDRIRRKGVKDIV